MIKLAEQSTSEHWDLLFFEKCAHLLKKNNLSMSLELSSMFFWYGKNAGILFEILEMCDKAHCINDDMIASLPLIEDLSLLTHFIEKLKQAQFQMSDQLIQAMMSGRFLRVFLLLPKFKRSFQSVIDFLSSKNITVDGAQGAKFLNHISHIEFLKVFDQLSQLNLFNQEVFDACMQIIYRDSGSNEVIDHAFHIISLLKNSGVVPTAEESASLFLLTVYEARRLNKIIDRLSQNSLLTSNSFHHMLYRVGMKLPSIEESTIVKHSRKTTGLARSEMVLNNQHHFFSDHSKKYAKVSYGVVKKVYSAIDATEAVYRIKKRSGLKQDYAVEEAIREGQGNQAIGGRPFFFFTKISKVAVNLVDLYTITTWFNEKSIDKFSPEELEQVMSEDKLRCIIDGCSDLNSFHHSDLVDGDVKPENFILDLKLLSMKMIDVGGWRKFGSEYRVSFFTPIYLDPYTDIHDTHFRMDIYSMGAVIMKMHENLYGSFPYENECKMAMSMEQWNHYREFYKEHRVIKTTDLTLIERAVIQLVNCMMNADVSARCNSEDAINYLQALIDNRHQLNEELLEKIAKSTIHRVNVTIEDTFRDSIRRPLV